MSRKNSEMLIRSPSLNSIVSQNVPTSDTWDRKLSLISSKYSAYPELVDKIRILSSECQEIATYVHEYDLDATIPGNGYRSISRTIDKFFSLLINLSDYDQNDIITLTKISGIFIHGLSYMIKMRRSSFESGKEEDGLLDLFCSDDNINLELFLETINLSDDMKYMFNSKFANFWLHSDFQFLLNKFYMPLVSIFWAGKFSFHQIFWKSNFVATTFANFCQNVDIDTIAYIWGLSELKLHKYVVPIIFNGLFKPKIRETRFIPRQDQNWIIDDKISFNVSKIDSRRFQDKESSTVRTRFLLHNYDACNDTLVLHVHGAGFVAQKPESHESYLRDWSVKLSNVPILSVDYSLSPDNKHPVALQEILDVYLFCVSAKRQVLSKLQFHPQKIILIGDSAGASLIMALAVVINEIRKHDPHIIEPTAIVPIYPAYNMHYSVCPSKLAVSYDSFLNTGVILQVLKAYIPLDDEEDNDLNQDKKENHLPWFKRSNAAQVLQKLNSKTKDPFVSPIFYQDFESMSKIRLFTIIGQFDPLLDDTIAMARKWKGSISLDIIPDVGHGFLYFSCVSNFAQHCTDIVCQRLIQAVKLF